MFTRLNFQLIPFYAKTLAFRRLGGDFWNSFLAGITKNPSLPEDPLAHLHLRAGPRPATVTETTGMVPDPENPEAYLWPQRKMIPNPNEDERALGRAVIHETPSYTPEVKAPFSKHQSTTFVHVSHNIRPQLFTAHTEVGNPCGVLIPAPMHFPLNPINEYALVNRIMKYDSGTIDRPYDSGNRGLKAEKQLRSHAAIYTAPYLAGITQNYTEILARLRWYNPLHSRPTPVDPRHPAILICASNNSEAFYQSVLLSLRRAFDLKFALFRKFNVVHNIPFVIYDSNARTPDNVLKGYFILNDNENLDEFILQIINGVQPLTTMAITTNDVSVEKQMVVLQRGLDKLLRYQRPDENFDALLSMPDFKDSLFYLETLRALITYATHLVVSGSSINTPLHPNNPKYSTEYRICGFNTMQTNQLRKGNCDSFDLAFNQILVACQ